MAGDPLANWSMGARALDGERVMTWDQSARVWDRWIARPARRFELAGVSCAAPGEDTLVAAGGGRISFFVLDFPTHGVVPRGSLPPYPGERCVRLVALPDGRYVAGTEIWKGEQTPSQRAGRSFVLDFEKPAGYRCQQMPEVELAVTDMQLCGDRLLVACGRSFEDGDDGKPNGRLHVYRFEGAKRPLSHLWTSKHKARLKAVCAEADGAHARVLDEVSRLLRVELSSGKWLKEDELTAVAGTGSAMLGDPSAHEGAPTALCLLPGGRLLSAATTELRVWSLEERTCLLHQHSLDPLWDVAVEHGQLVLSFVRQGSTPARVEVWPLEVLEPGKRRSSSFASQVRPLVREPR